MSVTITTSLRLLSPAFLGGAGPLAELRPPSLKGLLRFWYRAVDPRFHDHETDLFGGAGAGAAQSRVLLRVEAEPFAPTRWDKTRVQRFTEGAGTKAKNGLVYLGFALQLKGNLERTAIPAGARFTLRCVIPRPMSDEKHRRDRRAILAALWAFATCGSLGMRNRRGFGSLVLDAWDAGGAAIWDEDLRALPSPADAKDVGAWAYGFEKGRATIREWLGPFTGAQKHPHLGAGASARLLPVGVKGWEEALNHAGRQLQDFRQRWQPDYDNVKDHLRFRSREGGVKLRAAPERAAFGLPLAFRYSSLRGRVTSTIFVPHERDAAERGKPLERHPSTLFLKLTALPDGLHPLWLRLDGPLPGKAPQAIERGAPQPLAPPSRDAVGMFLQSLEPRKEP